MIPTWPPCNIERFDRERSHPPILLKRPILHRIDANMRQTERPRSYDTHSGATETIILALPTRTLVWVRRRRCGIFDFYLAESMRCICRIVNTFSNDAPIPRFVLQVGMRQREKKTNEHWAVKVIFALVLTREFCIGSRHSSSGSGYCSGASPMVLRSLGYLPPGSLRF